MYKVNYSISSNVCLRIGIPFEHSRVYLTLEDAQKYLRYISERISKTIDSPEVMGTGAVYDIRKFFTEELPNILKTGDLFNVKRSATYYDLEVSLSVI